MLLTQAAMLRYRGELADWLARREEETAQRYIDEAEGLDRQPVTVRRVQAAGRPV